MSQPSSTRPQPTDPQDRTIRRTWWVLIGSFVLLALVAALRFLENARPLDALFAILLVIVGGVAIRHRAAVAALEAGRRSEAESFARILQGLSRSVSPDAIVEAIVEELAAGTGADHVVVVRHRPGAPALDATLVSRRPGVPNSTTLLPLSDLEDPVRPSASRAAVALPVGEAATVAVGAGASPEAVVPPWVGRTRGAIGRVLGDLWPEAEDVMGAGAGAGAASAAPRVERRGRSRQVADRIAARVRDVYGLTHAIAAPLSGEEGVVGAIVISRRSSEAWPASAQRILHGAAVEASAALSRADSHRQAETLASTDSLTGLPNRRYFDEFCGLLARRRRADDAVGVLMIDIDRFKDLNDTHGHAAGDEVLRAVGRAIAQAVRDDDVPARYGGEEFAVLLRRPGNGIALEVGERVRAAIADIDLRRTGIPRVTVSVGVAVAAIPDQPIEELVRLADQALYRAKREGRNRVVAAG